MNMKKQDLYAPNESYRTAGVSNEILSAFSPKEMGEDVKLHVETMMVAAEKAATYELTTWHCQGVTGFIYHATLTRMCSMEERKEYWDRIDRALRLARVAEARVRDLESKKVKA